MLSGEVVLLAVDQHAAHERVRVELLDRKYAGSRNTGSKSGHILFDSLKQPLSVQLEENVCQFLSEKASRDYVAKLGRLQIFSLNIRVLAL